MGNLEIEELPSGVQAITGVATSIALFIGWTPDGPTDRALRLFGFADYERNYGGLDSRSLLGYSVRHFYDNGGSDAYVMRIAGNDGAVIDPNDAGFHTALESLFVADGAVDSIELFNIICMPGLADTAAIQTMQQRARERRAFLIVDCGEADTVATVTGSLTGKTGADAPNSAFYFPWVVAPDPLQQNAPRAFPPCGFVAGIFARVDASRGVWKAPAGVEALLAGATGLAVDVNDAENDLLNPRAINCLRSFPAIGHVVWGARTLDGDDSRGSEWKYVPVRRFALFLEQSIYSGTQWAVFEPNDEPLWAKIRRSVAVFMTALFGQGAFQGATVDRAWFVKCDRETTTQADIDGGVVNIVVGFAPLKPAEFVILTIARMAGPPLE